MSTKHTAGPWTARNSEDEITINCGDIYGAAIMPIRESDFPADEQHANAALIAAAPDLLAACEAAREYFGDPSDDQDAYPEATSLARQLRAALAKAKGGTEAESVARPTRPDESE